MAEWYHVNAFVRISAEASVRTFDRWSAYPAVALASPLGVVFFVMTKFFYLCVNRVAV